MPQQPEQDPRIIDLGMSRDSIFRASADDGDLWLILRVDDSYSANNDLPNVCCICLAPPCRLHRAIVDRGRGTPPEYVSVPICARCSGFERAVRAQEHIPLYVVAAILLFFLTGFVVVGMSNLSQIWLYLAGSIAVMIKVLLTLHFLFPAVQARAVSFGSYNEKDRTVEALFANPQYHLRAIEAIAMDKG